MVVCFHIRPIARPESRLRAFLAEGLLFQAQEEHMFAKNRVKSAFFLARIASEVKKS